MQLEIYQWLGPILSIFYIIRTFRQYTLGKSSPRNAVVWIVFWFGVALLCIMPNKIADSLAEGLGFQDRPNAIIFVALGLLFLMVFYLSAALNRIENQLTDLVRKIALTEARQEELDMIEQQNKLSSPTTTHITNVELGIINKSGSGAQNILDGIEELENIVNKLLPSKTDESEDNIPNAGKMPKSKSKK